MSNETVILEQPKKAQQDYPCQLCGNIRKTCYVDVDGKVVLDLIDPYATIVTCKEHREYQYMNNLDIAKALAGFGDGTYDEETILRLREHQAASKEKHNYILKLVRDNIAQPHADEIVNYIQSNVRGYHDK